MSNAKPLPILFEARATDSVETMDITREFVLAGMPLLEAGPAFMAAHDSLGINLKYDRATNRGWVTAAEAAAIREHMAANV